MSEIKTITVFQIQIKIHIHAHTWANKLCTMFLSASYMDAQYLYLLELIGHKKQKALEGESRIKEFHTSSK